MTARVSPLSRGFQAGLVGNFLPSYVLFFLELSIRLAILIQSDLRERPWASHEEFCLHSFSH